MPETKTKLTDEQMSEFNTPALQDFAIAFIDFLHSSPYTTNRKVFHYFKPLDADQLTEKENLYGLDRNKAYAELIKAFRICLMIRAFDGFFKNKNLYWQSTTIPKLVILKKWLNEPVVETSKKGGKHAKTRT